MPHSKLRAIGRALKEEESRFIGYAEIERKSKELGFGMTVRTLRFYVEENILPPPKKVGKTPVYEEEWILNVLLSIHLMKTRLGRSLTEIRTVLSRLQEDPALLADKLSYLYEDFAKGEALKPLERAGLVDAFFDLLTGRLGQARQAGEVRVAELVDAITTHGCWEGDSWVAPPAEAILASQGIGAAFDIDDEEDEADVDDEDDEGELLLPSEALDPPAPVPAPPPEAPPAAEPIPEGAVTLEAARAVEETFVQRFEANFEVVGRVHCPLDGRGYKAGPRERAVQKRDLSGKVIDLMKRHRVYDRSLLDQIPLGEVREFHVHQRGLFGKGDLKVVVAALCLSPLERFVQRRWADGPLGPRDAERALDVLPQREDVFYYVGLLSTVGWSPEAREAVPSRRNLLTCLVESQGGTCWRRHLILDPRWAGMDRVFDPETDREKVDRVREYMAEYLKPKGEFLIIRNLPDDLEVPVECVQAAIEELLLEDTQLEIVESGGREIIKRRRL